MRAGQTAVLEVSVEPRLVDGRHGTQAHADRRELPKLRHETWMRIAGQALPSDLLSEVLNLFVRQTTFEPSSRINAGRSVPLPVQVVARRTVVLPAEEVIEAEFPGVGNRGVGGNMAANAVKIFVRSSDHHHGVPTNDAVQALFRGEVTGIRALVVGMNGVEVGGFHHLDVHSGVLGSVHRSVQQTTSFLLAPLIGHGTNGVPPFLSRDGVGVGLCGPPSKPHGVSPVMMGLW